MTKITELKSDNIQKIRKCFYDGKIWTKNELSKHTMLALATATNVLQYLLKRQEIQYMGEAKSTGGRKSKQYCLNPDYLHLGLLNLKRDEQYHYLIIKSCNLFGKTVFKQKITSKTGELNEILKALDCLCENDLKIGCLSISIPGVCKNGVINICDFDALVNKDIGGLLKERYQMPIIIENDVNVAGMGFSKHYDTSDNLALLYQPKVKYIGCSLIINHQLCPGFSNFAGELAYLPIYTHRQQQQLLKENPYLLLLKQLVSLCCVTNPEIVGVSSDVIDDFKGEGIEEYLPIEHCPQIVYVKDFDGLIYEGLVFLGIELILKKIKEGEE